MAGYPDVWITVTEVDRGFCRLGFDTSAVVEIKREELLPPADRYAATRVAVPAAPLNGLPSSL